MCLCHLSRHRNGSLRAVPLNDGSDSHRPPQGFRGTSGGNESIVVRIGCSSWSYAHWRGVLYPVKGSTASWLELHAQRIDTVDVNATFIACRHA
jgi:hypothetical protein